MEYDPPIARCVQKRGHQSGPAVGANSRGQQTPSNPFWLSGGRFKTVLRNLYISRLHVIMTVESSLKSNTCHHTDHFVGE